MMHVTTFEAHRSVSDVAFLPDRQTLAIGYADRNVELWHADRDKAVLKIEAELDPRKTVSASQTIIQE